MNCDIRAEEPKFHHVEPCVIFKDYLLPQSTAMGLKNDQKGSKLQSIQKTLFQWALGPWGRLYICLNVVKLGQKSHFDKIIIMKLLKHFPQSWSHFAINDKMRIKCFLT